ncbi:9103_t:CDS:2 [Dentiscutata erythropus]|uniref:9103_t:CDS:1 n=1 Tax=Dentiscutata erythropus TaxID=1348616 RepID=A0A9N9H8W1_9GLOM|nr:9103_t:CDS:2 [Dentiscutata erythropus]
MAKSGLSRRLDSSRNYRSDSNEQSSKFNKLTERRAMESLRMSEYLSDVVKYLQLLSRENVKINVIKQTLELLLKTAKIQKGRSKELMNDYISFYNGLNNVKRPSITNMLIYCLLVFFLVITIIYNFYLLPEYFSTSHYSKIFDLKNYNISSYIDFCKDINCYRDKCSNHTSSDIKDTHYNFTANDGYKFCGYFLENNPDPKDSYECLSGKNMQTPSFNQFFFNYIRSFFNYVSSADESYCEKKNEHILQNTMKFYEICECLLKNRIDDVNSTYSLCERWQIIKPSNNTVYYSFNNLLLVGCLAIIIFIIKGMMDWIIQQDNYQESDFIRHIKDRFPGIKDNIIILDEFWNTQIIIINDHISNLESINVDKIKLPNQIVDSIVRIWDEESKRCKSCYYKLTESVALNSMLDYYKLTESVALNSMLE